MGEHVYASFRAITLRGVESNDAEVVQSSINSLKVGSGPLAGLRFFWYFSDRVNANLQHVAYEFGAFRLEPSEHRLMREGTRGSAYGESL